MSWLWGKRLQKNDSENICTVERTSGLCDGDAQNYAELKKSHNSSPVKKLKKHENRQAEGVKDPQLL
jgi:hypothetical protein